MPCAHFIGERLHPRRGAGAAPSIEVTVTPYETGPGQVDNVFKWKKRNPRGCCIQSNARRVHSGPSGSAADLENQAYAFGLVMA